MAGLPRFDRRMSDAEGLMWRLESDPTLSSTFGNITILDRAPDMAVLRRRLTGAAKAVPRLRQRVQPSAMSRVSPLWAPPSWAEDPDFDLDYHLRRVALPEPGSLRQLLDLATLITSDPFDRWRPLWSFTVVEGLKGGQAAVVQKLHHTIADGETGLRLSLEFLDLEREATQPASRAMAAPIEPPDPQPEANGDLSGGADVADNALRELIDDSLKLPRGALRQLRHLLADPTKVPAAGTAAAGAMRGAMAQLSDVDPARSPLWTERSLRRRLETLRVPLNEAKVAATHLGGTLNTLFLTAAAQAAGDYHRDLGFPVEQLRASMAVSTRRSRRDRDAVADGNGDEPGANAFTLTRMLVPTSEMPAPERFAAIHELAVSAREASASSSFDSLAALTAALPTGVLTRMARQQAQTVDFATSNVRGAPIALYLAGAKVLKNFPVGPLGGVAFNVTSLSYLGSFDVGLNIDTRAVAQPERLKRLLRRAFAELVAAAPG
jgi:WS/DGAT/MGAT family acyltransferase